ncbi:MAG: hypothetical protein ACYDAR_19345, partial [Thermomicrobiales bacterium]
MPGEGKEEHPSSSNRRFRTPFFRRRSRLGGLILFPCALLIACGGANVTPTAAALTAQRTALAQLTAIPGTPTTRAATTVSTRPAFTATAPRSGSTPAPATTPAVPAIPVTETPGLKPLVGGMTYTNPAKTYRIDLPSGWMTPAPDPAHPGRVVTKAPKDAVTMTIEEDPTPNDWTGLA